MFKNRKFEIITILSIQLKAMIFFDCYTYSQFAWVNPNYICLPRLTWILPCLLLLYHLTSFLLHLIPPDFLSVPQTGLACTLFGALYALLFLLPEMLPPRFTWVLLLRHWVCLNGYILRETSPNMWSSFSSSSPIILRQYTLFISFMKTIYDPFMLVYLPVCCLSSQLD